MADPTGAQIKASFAKALQLQNAGQAEAALALYTNIVMERPATAEAHFQIGRIHAAAGRLPQAKAALLKALDHRPRERAIWNALAAVTPKDDHDALAVQIADGLPKAERLNYATTLRGEGRHSAAEAVLWALVEAGMDDARLPLSQRLKETCRFEEAESVLSAAKTKSGELWYTLALARAALRRPRAAQKAMQKAVRSGAKPAPAAVALASALWKEDEREAALDVIDDAVARYPDAGMLVGQRGQMLQSVGEMARAQDDLRRAVSLDPSDGEAIRAYMAGAKINADDPMLAQAEAALARHDLTPANRWRVHFALAKALDEVGRHGEVFEHLHKANALQKKEFPFDFKATRARAKAQLDATRDHLLGKSPEGPTDPVFFVTGMPRSGTTLVETILASHSQVAAGGELPFLPDALRPFSERVDHGATVTPEMLAPLAARYLQASRRRLDTSLAFTDKSVATYYRIGPAAFALPGARFFVLRRDPLDVGLSIYRNMFAGGTQRFATDLRMIGRVIGLQNALVEAWRAMFPDRVHIVDYEALTAEPERQIRHLIEAADLPWEDACLAPHLSKRRVETLSFAQVREPIYRSAVEGWRRYEHELGPLKEGLSEPVDLTA